MAGRRTRRYRPRGRIPSLCPLRAQARLRQLFRVSRPEVFLGGFVGEWSGRAAKGPGLAATHPWFRRGRSRSACVANGQEYLPARGAVCRIPCRILCLADVERNSMARGLCGPRRVLTPGAIQEVFQQNLPGVGSVPDAWAAWSSPSHSPSGSPHNEPRWHGPRRSGHRTPGRGAALPRVRQLHRRNHREGTPQAARAPVPRVLRPARIAPRSRRTTARC